MKYYVQQSRDKTMDDKMALYCECYFRFVENHGEWSYICKSLGGGDRPNRPLDLALFQTVCLTGLLSVQMPTVIAI